MCLNLKKTAAVNPKPGFEYVFYSETLELNSLIERELPHGKCTSLHQPEVHSVW